MSHEFQGPNTSCGLSPEEGFAAYLTKKVINGGNGCSEAITLLNPNSTNKQIHEAASRLEKMSEEVQSE